MSEQVIIGADVGTTGCRAVVYLTDGTVVASRSREYPLYTPQPGWAEQDAVFLKSEAYSSSDF